MTERVWYASYGSNLLRERFVRYLVGGRYGPARESSDHAGARDPALPGGDTAEIVGHQLRFGQESRRWGGAVAFVDPEPGSGRAHVRLWDVSAEQFADVAAQENGLDPGGLHVDLDELARRGRIDTGGRWYGTALWCGERDGRPIVTFTCPEVFPPAAPGADYLTAIVRGLIECAHLDVDGIVSYLLASPGVADGWAPASLTALVSELAPSP